MNESQVSVEQIVSLARQLSPIQKLQLIKQLTPDLEEALKGAGPPQCRGLRGILTGCNLTREDVDAVREEMWGNFGRGDL